MSAADRDLKGFAKLNPDNTGFCECDDYRPFWNPVLRGFAKANLLKSLSAADKDLKGVQFW